MHAGSDLANPTLLSEPEGRNAFRSLDELGNWNWGQSSLLTRSFPQSPCCPELCFGTGDQNFRLPIETRLLPSSLAASHRGFAFCLADPVGSAGDLGGVRRFYFLEVFGGSSRTNDHETSAVWPLS
jgi:hypothetical protein